MHGRAVMLSGACYEDTITRRKVLVNSVHGGEAGSHLAAIA
jgi:hypothetical protein